MKGKEIIHACLQIQHQGILLTKMDEEYLRKIKKAFLSQDIFTDPSLFFGLIYGKRRTYIKWDKCILHLFHALIHSITCYPYSLLSKIHAEMYRNNSPRDVIGIGTFSQQWRRLRIRQIHSNGVHNEENYGSELGPFFNKRYLTIEYEL